MKTKRIISLLLTAAMAASALAGCGGFTGGSAAASSGAASSGAAGGASGTAAASDTLVVYDENEIRTMVQWAASDSNTFTLSNNTFEGLYRLDKNHEPQPALAESHEVSSDKLTYTFKLREGLEWSDGTPLTASDFVFSWRRQMSTDATNDYQFIMTDYIQGGAEFFAGDASVDVAVKALDERTLEVKLKQPTPYFLRLTVLAMYFPLNEAYVSSKGEQYGLTAADMIYSGPYVLKTYDPAAGSVLVKNEKYWDAANVKIPTVDVRIIKEQSSALNAYKAGEISKVKLSSSDVPVMKNDPEFETQSEFRTTYLQFNPKNEAISNYNIRMALGYAIDRQTMADVVLADGSAPASGLVADNMAGGGGKTFREAAGNVSPFDAAKAKEYWDKGVAEMGKAPDLTLLVADDSVTKTVATYVQSQFKTTLGIDVKIDSKTMKARNELMDNDNYQMAITAWGADYDDGMTYLDLWTMGTPYRGNYSNEEYNALIAAAKVETDDIARLDDMVKAEKKLVVDDAIVSPLFYRGFAYLTKANLKDLVLHPFGPPIEFKYAYFE